MEVVNTSLIERVTLGVLLNLETMINRLFSMKNSKQSEYDYI